MIHPHAELRFVSEQIGYGVFATASIPRGTLTYVTDPLEIIIQPGNPLLYNPLYRPLLDKFSTREPDGSLMLSWDIAKHVNHCCHFNTISTGYGFEIAVRDIAAGEEITDEYAIFNLDYEMDLYCHYPDCRVVLRLDDFDRLYPVWDEQIRAALQDFQRVEQPLWVYMEEAVRQELLAYLETGENYKSVYALRYKEDDQVQDSSDSA